MHVVFSWKHLSLLSFVRSYVQILYVVLVILAIETVDIAGMHGTYIYVY